MGGCNTVHKYRSRDSPLPAVPLPAKSVTLNRCKNTSSSAARSLNFGAVSQKPSDLNLSSVFSRGFEERKFSCSYERPNDVVRGNTFKHGNFSCLIIFYLKLMWLGKLVTF